MKKKIHMGKRHMGIMRDIMHRYTCTNLYVRHLSWQLWGTLCLYLHSLYLMDEDYWQLLPFLNKNNWCVRTQCRHMCNQTVINLYWAILYFLYRCNFEFELILPKPTTGNNTVVLPEGLQAFVKMKQIQYISIHQFMRRRLSLSVLSSCEPKI